MRTLPMLVSGATFTGLLLMLPALTWSTWAGRALPSLTLALVALPIVFLLIAITAPRAPVTHFAFFASHLPALVLEPGLTGPEVYSGGRGLIAVAVIGAIGLAWVWACRWAADAPAIASEGEGEDPTQSAAAKPDPRRPNAERPRTTPVLGLVAGTAALATYSAFAVAALSSPQTQSPQAASVTLLVGLIVAWYVGAVQVVNRIGSVALDVRASRRVLASLFIERRRSKADIWTTVVWLVAALLGALLWYLP